jgi:dihydropteroate synthase
MAVLNVTPDSFFDGGRYEGAAVFARIDQLLDEGAFALDIGAESTRPGAAAVSTSTQLERLESAVGYAVKSERCWVSIDTTDPVVADQCLRWGAHIINDVSCLARPALARVTALHGGALIVMHARGAMETMAGFSQYPDSGYGDIVSEVMSEWLVAREAAIAQGMTSDDILFDPGIGFAKNATQSLAVLERLSEFRAVGAPLVLGPSRKSFLQLVEECPPTERLGATISACLLAADQGTAMLRVHDVQVVRQALLAQRFFHRHDGNQPKREATCSTAS